MNYLFVFSIIFILLLLALLTKIVKGFLKMFFLASTIVTLLLVVFSYFIYIDVTEFKEGWEQSPKLFLLQDKGYLISGFKADPQNVKTPIYPLSREVMDSYKDPFTKEDYDAILGENYKLFIIDFTAFEKIDTLNVFGTELKLAQVKEMLDSDTPTKDFMEINLGQTLNLNIPKDQDEMFRSSLFSGLFANAIKKEGPLFIVSKVKDKRVLVYPETALFKSIKLIPLSLFKQAFTQVVEVSEQGAVAAAVAINNLIDERKGDFVDILR
ncbi:hypothetical protein J4418_02360 [Candidatus Woesearchaeota archaeon]|nr:hypothetical protein [Candidatus Woesearchaeota archaeon]